MDYKLPDINIVFRGLGTSIVQRGARGNAVLIVPDDTVDPIHLYKGIDEFDSDEQSKFTADNVQYIKDVLEGIPSQLQVVTVPTAGALSDVLGTLKSKIPRNCWIAMADASDSETSDLATFVKAARTNDRKRYKLLAYKNVGDAQGVTNYTANNVEIDDARGETTGDKAVPYIMGQLAGLPLTMSAIGIVLNKLKWVEEPADINAAIAAGEFVLMNDDGVRVARSVNSLTTVAAGMKDSMKLIQVTEIQDMIYTDIYTTWNNHYKGKYPNGYDEQSLLIGAINGYYSILASQNVLDKNGANKAYINTVLQRAANVSVYGEEFVSGWSEDEIKRNTVDTFVYLGSKIKPKPAMEDIDMDIII